MPRLGSRRTFDVLTKRTSPQVIRRMRIRSLRCGRGCETTVGGTSSAASAAGTSGASGGASAAPEEGSHSERPPGASSPIEGTDASISFDATLPSALAADSHGEGAWDHAGDLATGGTGGTHPPSTSSSRSRSPSALTTVSRRYHPRRQRRLFRLRVRVERPPFPLRGCRWSRLQLRHRLSRFRLRQPRLRLCHRGRLHLQDRVCLLLRRGWLSNPLELGLRGSGRWLRSARRSCSALPNWTRSRRPRERQRNGLISRCWLPEQRNRMIGIGNLRLNRSG